VSDVTELSNIAQMGALVGDPVRALIVGALMDGTEHAAGELAVLAGATPQAASPHLALLVDGGLLTVSARGIGTTVCATLRSLTRSKLSRLRLKLLSKRRSASTPP